MKPYKNGRGSFDVILENIKLLSQHNVQELLCDNGINKYIGLSSRKQPQFKIHIKQAEYLCCSQYNYFVSLGTRRPRKECGLQKL